MLNKVHSFLPPLHLNCLAGWQQGVQTENVFHCPLAQKQNCYAGGVCWKFSFLLATPAPKCFPRPACPETELQQGIGAKNVLSGLLPQAGRRGVGAENVLSCLLPQAGSRWVVAENCIPSLLLQADSWGSVLKMFCYPRLVLKLFFPACYPRLTAELVLEMFSPACYPRLAEGGLVMKMFFLPPTPDW